MRNVSNAFKRALYENKRNYVCTATITLTDNTVLTVTNAEIWQNGLSTNENVSDESTFGALGSVVVNSATLIINNIDEVYSQYDFTGAVVSINVGLLIGTSVESVKMGTFTVDDAQYNGALITLNCLDNMAKFDKPYSESTLVYPATLGTIVNSACTDCGVILATPSFPNYNFQIDTRPTDTAITYREVISYAAVIAGCFAKCNNNGALELKWFDTDALQTEESGVDGGIFDITTADVYQSGDNVNGGTFNPWDIGDVVDGGSFTDTNVVHHITALSSQDFSVDPVIITGIQLTVDSTVNAELTTVDHLYGTEGYLIKVEKNPFITETNVDAIGNYLSTNLVGLTFRKANITHLNDPSIEAGDVAIVIDRKEKIYPILITNTTFNVSSYQTTICAADTPVRNSATRYSAITKSQVEAQTLVKQEKTLRETMGTNLTQAINAKAGMYETQVQEAGGGYTYYMHDKPNLNESTAVIKITNEAVGITPNYQATPITWYGLTVDGNFIANIMSVIGIDFDWGTGGSLILGGNGNGNGTLTINDANDQPIGYWNNTGINAQAGTIGPWTIGATGIYNGKTQYGDGVNGTYIGTNGEEFESSAGIYRVDLSSGLMLIDKTFMGEYGLTVVHPNLDFQVGVYQSDVHCVFTNSDSTRKQDYVFLLTSVGVSGGGQAGMLDLYHSHKNRWITIDASEPKIQFMVDTDTPIITAYRYVTDTWIEYNLIRNHNNGNVSVSASGSGLYLGYENTTLINFLHSAGYINTTELVMGNANGRYSAMYPSGAIRARSDTTENAWIQAENGTNVNAIAITSDSTGTVRLWSRSADGTTRTILQRDNNSSAITAYGTWTFNTGIKGNNNYTGIPVLTESSGASRISYMASATGYVLRVNALWGGSTFATASATFTSSDIRLKENIKNSTVKALPIVDAINIREFDWKDGRHQSIGFIADELEKLDKNLAVGGGKNEDGTMNIKSVDTFYLLGYLTKAVQELSAEVTRLKKKLGE